MPIVAFSRWDPLRDLIALHEQIGHLVGTDAPGWPPPVDLYETATDYILTADLPGLAREQIPHLAVAHSLIVSFESLPCAEPVGRSQAICLRCCNHFGTLR